ncbi:hypothetical protein QYE76_026713 [Lolium multiflorum]|uniref:Kinesin motor domain-containing protein n=1 Tax=Lolium multiflorum TaxID=4521 RepID=A0AAD8RI82_LOLMU|nr:hypothetical protein QYE76_026713 [Lolium multiflorum]
MSPPPLPPLPPRPSRLTLHPSPAPAASASKRPGTTPAPSSNRHPGGAGRVTMERIMEVIGSIRSDVRGETGAVETDAGARTPFKRRLDIPTPCTTAPNTKRRLDVTPYTSSTPKSRRRLADSPSGDGSPTRPRRTPPRAAAEHPVEVIGRIRNLTAEASALETGATFVRVRVPSHDAGGGRDFTLDGVSASEEEGLEGFYGRFVRSRVERVRAGAKCTVMVYGPTGSGKTHTMFGSDDQPGIVFRALWDVLGGGGGNGCAPVQVSFLEIYNEEVYDLLAGSGGANAKGPKPKVRLEVMGTRARNATYISENEAGKIAKEVVKLEKRRAVKSTHCNSRSSRSHCMVGCNQFFFSLIIVDVPSVGGRLMLVDMAGSENIEAVGQTGHEAKSETGSINQGTTTLKRVVESIANGDSHIPFRDSKLTMLLRDSFEDKRSKILMILCASPDPKELHKTISTLEYGARAKCITRAAHASIPRDKVSSKEAHNAIRLKDEELARLRTKLSLVEAREATAQEEVIRVAEETQFLWGELRKTEDKLLMQQQELIAMKQRLQEVEREKLCMDE